MGLSEFKEDWGFNGFVDTIYKNKCSLTCMQVL